MRTVLWVAALLANIAVTFAAGAVTFADGVPYTARGVSLVLGLVAAAAALLLVLSRASRLPPWGPVAMRVLCASFPLLWLLGSLDHGILSGQELLSLILVAALYWGTWRVFRASSPAAA